MPEKSEMPQKKDLPQKKDMLDAARRARENAHAPYSGFKVGACIKSLDGRLFSSCNVENVAYPQGQCAEAGAIAAMVSAGGKGISEVLIVAEGEALCTPCGGCRQRLAEFSEPQTLVHIAGPEGLRASFTLGELLPHAFHFDDAKKDG